MPSTAVSERGGGYEVFQKRRAMSPPLFPYPPTRKNNVSAGEGGGPPVPEAGLLLKRLSLVRLARSMSRTIQ